MHEIAGNGGNCSTNLRVCWVIGKYEVVKCEMVKLCHLNISHVSMRHVNKFNIKMCHIKVCHVKLCHVKMFHVNICKEFVSCNHVSSCNKKCAHTTCTLGYIRRFLPLAIHYHLY